jgi:hypothetical protein
MELICYLTGYDSCIQNVHRCIVILFNFVICRSPKFRAYTLLLFFPCCSTTQFWALAASVKLSVSFQFLRSRTVSRTPWTSDQLVARTLLTAPGDYDDDVGGMNRFGRGHRSTRRKPAPTPLCPPQIPLARPGREPGPPLWEATNRFSYVAALNIIIL